MPNEADTCRRYVVPKLQAAGWDDEPHRLSEQVTFTDGRIVVARRQGRRRRGIIPTRTAPDVMMWVGHPSWAQGVGMSATLAQGPEPALGPATSGEGTRYD